MELPARYQALEKLGAGAMGEVWRVLDREQGTEVALKRWRPEAGAPSADALALFRREYGTMASLRHPALVAAHEYGEGPDGLPYFTMELVLGSAPCAPQSEDSLRLWVPEIAQALAFLHAQGWVHGDVKPENLRLLPGGGAKLMDLGLLAPVGQVGGPLSGSPAYMAPERFLGAAIDARTDMYALGVTLFELLSGQCPFPSDGGLLALAQAHVGQAAPALRSLVPTASLALNEAVGALLAKEPQARGEGVGAFLARLGWGSAEAHEGLMGSPWVGLAETRAQVLASLEGGGAALLLHLQGPEGAGKSRLLAEGRAQAQLGAWRTLSVQGLGPDAPPYQALRPLFRAWLEAAPAESRRVAWPLLAPYFPEEGWQAAPPLEGAAERSRFLMGMLALARAACQGPTVWVLDDADRFDAASWGLLGQLQAAGAALPWRWWLASRAAQALPGQTLAASELLELPPLNEAEVASLVRALLGSEAAPDALESRLAALERRPGVVETLLRAWVRSRALRREGGAWVVPHLEALALPSSGHSPLAIAFEGLPEAALEVARVLAILGPGATLPCLLATAAQPPEASFAGLESLEARGLVRREGAEVSLRHQGHAAALVVGWQAAEAAAAHGRAGRFLAGQAEPESAPLALCLPAAQQLLASDSPEAGLPWAIAAGRKALQSHTAGGLEPLLRQALALAPEGGLPWLQLKLHLAAIARFLGRVDEALAAHEALAPHLPLLPPAEAARATTTLGSLLQQKGRYPEAAACYAQAETSALAVGALAEAARAAFMAARTAYFMGEVPAASAHLSRLRPWLAEPGCAPLVAPALSFAGYVMASQEPERLPEALALMAEALAGAEAVGDPLALHEAQNNRGNLLLGVGRYAEALGAFQACEALAAGMGNHNELIFAHLNSGIACLELGAYLEAAKALPAALGLAREQGRRFPEALALAQWGLLRLRMGAPAEAMPLLDEGVAIAQALGNAYAEAIARAARAEALLELGRLDDALQELASLRALAEASKSQEHLLKAERLEAACLAIRQAPEATARLEDLAESARAAGRDDLLAAALRWRIDGLFRGGALEEARALLPEALAAAQEAGTQALEAELAFLAGQLNSEPTEAQAHFARTSALGEAMASPLLMALGAHGQGHHAEAKSRMQALLAGLSPAERAAYLRFPERLAALSPRQEGEGASGGLPVERLRLLADLVADAAQKPDLDGVLLASVAALVELSGMSRAFLLLYEDMEVSHKVFYGMVSEEVDEHSEGLAQRVAWGGKPLYVADIAQDEELAARGSVMALGLRSALALPLLATQADGHQEVVGVMLADSQHLLPHFGPEDMAAAEALAQLVAALVVAARRQESQQQGLDEAEALLALACRLLEAPSPEARWAALAAEALGIAKAERCLVLQGEALRPVLAFGPGGQALPLAAQEISRSVATWVWEQGEALQLLDAQEEEGFAAQRSVAALGLRTVMVVPIGRGAAKQGLLYLDSQRVQAPSPSALKLLEGLGDLASRLGLSGA